MIQLQKVTLRFGSRDIFDGISAVFDTYQKVGLVGRNGAGKSTLLKAIAGHIAIDGGAIALDKEQKIAYLAQEVVLESPKSIFDEAYSVFQKFIDLQQEQDEIEAKLAQNPEDAIDLFERYNQVLAELDSFDKGQATQRTQKILTGLGFSEEMQLQPVSTFSVGWKMRLVLAKLLLEDADFYLFDEPTNHLDMISKEWFFDFLRGSRFGYLLVSHDRYFLDKACDHIFDIANGQGTLYTGGFSKYLSQKAHAQETKQVAYERQQREIERKQATIERFRASATKAKMAQSMIKQLDKIERIEVDSEMPTIRLSFPESTRAGAVVLSVKNVKKSFDQKTVFKNAQAEIMRGEKVAIIAPNGGGKTTFFNVLTDTYKPEEGSIQFGHNVAYAVFEQDQTRVLSPNKTIFQEVLDACPQVTEAAVRSFLGAFLFSGDDIFKKISVLSGGERNRVAMVKVLLQKANFLLLDEPTNHLDLYAKEVLLQALQQYDGTILFVSHDHDFLQKVATRILELTPQGLLNYPGNYEAYMYAKKQAKPESKQEKTVSIKSEAPKMDQQVLRKEFNNAESKVSKYEKEIQNIHAKFVTVDYGSKEYDVLAQKLKAAEKQLQEAQAIWEELAGQML